MANIKKRQSGEVVLSEDMVRSNIQTAISQLPELISFDITDPEKEMLALRCAVDPGVPATQRDGWRGTVVQWWVGPYQVPDEETGEMITLPCLVLIPAEGELVRLTGWPAINHWAQILRAATAERCLRGIKVRVARRASSTTKGSYWCVLPDA